MPPMPEVSSQHAFVTRPKSAMAITSLVIGLVALLTSLLPFINNFSFFLALLGVLFGLVGLVATLRGTRSGKALAIAALVVNIVAAAAVLASQEAYSNALDEAFDGPAVVATSTTNAGIGSNDGASTSANPTNASAATDDLAPGTAIELASGLSVSVDTVQSGLVEYDGSTVTAVTVTYTNNGSSDASFNMLDWEAQTPQGVKNSATIYFGETATGESLSAGGLVPGGSVTGTIFFDGDIVKVFYNASLFSSQPSASWTIG